jgi:hypothetical protein
MPAKPQGTDLRGQRMTANLFDRLSSKREHMDKEKVR